MRTLKKQNIYILYTAFFALVAFLIFLPMIIDKKTLIASNDAFNQYYCVFCYLGRWIREGFTKGFKLYDTCIGLGESVIGSLNYYGFGDILFFPFVLFPEKYAQYGYTLSIIYRIYLGGLFFVYGCNRRGYGKEASVVGALIYCLSPFTMTNGLLFLSYTTVLAWFPLIAFSIEEILNIKGNSYGVRAPLTLVCSLFFLGLTGFYFIWMVLWYCLCRCIVHVVFNKFSAVELKKILYLAMCGVAGVGSSSVLLLPVTLFFEDSSRNIIDDFLRVFVQLPTKDELIDSFRNLVTPPTHIYDTLSFSIPVLLVIILIYLVLHKDIAKRKQLLLAVLVCAYGYFMPAVGMIMNGFERRYSRWPFMAEFFFAVLFARLFPEWVRNFKKKDIIAAVIAAASWLMIYLYAAKDQSITGLRAVYYSVLWLVTIFVVVALKKQENKNGKYSKALYSLLCFTAIFNVALNGFLVSADEALGGGQAKNVMLRGGRSYTDTTMYRLSLQESDKPWKRDDVINKYMTEESMVCGLNTVHGYLSMMNLEGEYFFYNLKINPLKKGLDARQIPVSLLSVDNYSIRGWDSWETEQNKYFLPLGFVYEGYLTDASVADLTPLEKQNAMMSAVVLSEATDEDLPLKKEAKPGTVTEISYEVSYIDCSQDQGKISVQPDSKMLLTINEEIPEDGLGELYVFFDDIKTERAPQYIFVGGKEVGLGADPDDFYICVDEVIEDGTVEISFSDENTITADNIKLLYSRSDDFLGEYNKLLQHSMTDTKWGASSYSGKISGDEGYLFLSLPYERGWKCKIDGKYTDVYKADYAFLAVHVPAGEHDIRFEYHISGLIAGICISFVCILLAAWLIYIMARRKHEEQYG